MNVSQSEFLRLSKRITKRLDEEVIGPASSIDESIAVFCGTDGKTIKDSCINKSELMVARGSIASDVDFNEITEAGIYTLGNSSGYSNDPDIDWGVLRVSVTNVNYIVQEAWYVGGGTYRLRSRNESNGWSTWETVWTSEHGISHIDARAVKGLGEYGGDANTSLNAYFLSMSNTPTAVWYYIKQQFYDNVTAASNRCQIAMPYYSASLNMLYFRYRYNGSWTAWVAAT